MSHLFFIHLLGVCLLLSQPCRGAQPQAWWDQVIKLCNRELVREIINICGHVAWERPRSVRESGMASGLSSEITPSSINKDAYLINMEEYIPDLPEEPKATQSERQPSFLDAQQHYQPTVKNSTPGFEEFKKFVPNRQGEVEDNGPSELRHSGLKIHSRKKRQKITSLTEYCCHVGCTRRTVKQYC